MIYYPKEEANTKKKEIHKQSKRGKVSTLRKVEEKILLPYQTQQASLRLRNFAQ